MITNKIRTRVAFQRVKILLLVLLVANCCLQKVNALANLTEPWVEGPLYNRNKAKCAIDSLMRSRIIRGYVILQDGKIVAEGYPERFNQNGIYHAWSVTKNWSSMLIGKMIELGMVRLEETLGDIFDRQEEDWSNVTDAAIKQTITLEEVLTMTSGLTPGPEEFQEQRNLQEILNYSTYQADVRGTFLYMPLQHILAPIILRRSGLTPRQFVQEYGIFAKLGIEESDYTWETFGDDGLEGSAYGLWMNPRAMAKLGQLYIQKGFVAEGDQLIRSDWIEASTTNQLPDGELTNYPLFRGYGYRWWLIKDARDLFFDIDESFGGAYMAAGNKGQFIAVSEKLNSVLVIMAEDFTTIFVFIFFSALVRNLDDLQVEQETCDENIFNVLLGYSDAIFYLVCQFLASQL